MWKIGKHEPHATTCAMAVAHFTYFKGRGHGERVRYALAAAGIEYTETFLVSPGDMDAIRPKCLLNQCPLLEIDGLQLVQSWAIVRYLAAKSGLTPAAPALAFRADALAEQVRDFTVAGEFTGFGWAPGFFEGEEGRAPGQAKIAAACARYLPTFEGAVAEGGCLTGEAPCWAGASSRLLCIAALLAAAARAHPCRAPPPPPPARPPAADFQLLYLLNYSVEVLGEGALAQHAKLAALRSRLNADPRMQAHFAQHAQGLVTPEYIAQVKAAQLPKAP